MTRKLIIFTTPINLGSVLNSICFQILGIQGNSAQNLFINTVSKDYTVYVYNWRPNFSGVFCVNQLKWWRLSVWELSQFGKTLQIRNYSFQEWLKTCLEIKGLLLHFLFQSRRLPVESLEIRKLIIFTNRKRFHLNLLSNIRN